MSPYSRRRSVDSTSARTSPRLRSRIATISSISSAVTTSGGPNAIQWGSNRQSSPCSSARRPTRTPKASRVRKPGLGRAVAHELDRLEQAPCRARRRSPDISAPAPRSPLASRAPWARAFSSRSRSMISRSTAMPAAHEIGLPSNVCPSTKPGFSAIGPQKASAIVSAADHRRERCIAAGEALGDAEHVGRDSEGFGGEHPARAADAGDDLVKDQEDIVAVADLAKDRQVLFGRDRSRRRCGRSARPGWPPRSQDLPSRSRRRRSSRR